MTFVVSLTNIEMAGLSRCDDEKCTLSGDI